MNYNGREVDVLSLWGEFLDLPNGISSPLPTFLPLVRCPNPAHDTHKRHFQVNTRKPLVHCFAGCGISGTYEHAIATILDQRRDDGELDLRAARRVILRHSRVALGREDRPLSRQGTRKAVGEKDAVAEDERRIEGGYYQYLPRHARNYLDVRGIDESSRGLWRIGYDEDTDRIVIPAYDLAGNFRFLIKRSITGGHPKYLYTPGAIKTSLLFGASMIPRDTLQSLGLVLIEGSLDRIRLHQLGIETAGAILGSGLSDKQVRIISSLSPRRIFCFFDKDAAGVRNIQIVSQRLKRFPIFVCRYPANRFDPAELTREEAHRAIERALPIHAFQKNARNALKEALA